MKTYKAIYIEKSSEGTFSSSLVNRSVDDLPEGEVLIKVQYSALNYKDAMSIHGIKGITREYPHQPGVDAAGIVEQSSESSLNIGDEVIVTGYDLGMNTAGGLAEYIRVPANWVIKCPKGMTLKESMCFGTAGLTAQLCLNKLERMGLVKDQGPVLVTGSTGGVGSIAVALLSNAGYEVIASSGKSEQIDFLKSLGAKEVMDRHELSEVNKRPLLKEQYAGIIDVVGGETLVNAMKMLKPGASAACCGLVQSPQLNGTVLPFILRGVNLLGVDSVEIALSEKEKCWKKLAEVAKDSSIKLLTEEVVLADVPEAITRLFSGSVVGHILVKVAS